MDSVVAWESWAILARAVATGAAAALIPLVVQSVTEALHNDVLGWLGLVIKAAQQQVHVHTHVIRTGSVLLEACTV